MPVAVQNTKKSLPLKKIGVLAGLLLTIVAILSGLIAVNQRADIRNRAAGPACTTFDARCAWSAIPGVSEYEYTYTISGTDETAISGKTDKTSFEFPAKPGIIYTCTVKALGVPSSCGKIQESSSSKLCSNSETPTTTPVPSPTPTSTPITKTALITQNPITPTLPPSEKSPSVTPGLTPQSIISPTPTTSVTTPGSQTSVIQNTTTPIPTSIVIVKATNTPGPSPTSGPTSIAQTSSIPTNVPPPTAGIFLPTLGILSIGITIVALGLLI